MFAIVHVIFPAEEKARALCLSSVLSPAAPAAALLAGGPLIGLGVFGPGWRSVFLINGPLGLASLIASMRVLPREGAQGSSLDL